jgi:hypothetical protein
MIFQPKYHISIDRSFIVFTPAEESHGLWLWMNAQTFGRGVASLRRQSVDTGFARGAPQERHLLTAKQFSTPGFSCGIRRIGGFF